MSGKSWNDLSHIFTTSSVGKCAVSKASRSKFQATALSKQRVISKTAASMGPGCCLLVWQATACAPCTSAAGSCPSAGAWSNSRNLSWLGGRMLLRSPTSESSLQKIRWGLCQPEILQVCTEHVGTVTRQCFSRQRGTHMPRASEFDV